MALFKIFKGKNKRWYFNLTGDNNKIMLQSQSYITRWGTNRGIKRIKAQVADAKVLVMAPTNLKLMINQSPKKSKPPVKVRVKKVQ